jgi:serine/threonine protein kinase
MDEACEIALQACEALVEVHAAGIVHRDLKPSNLFVTRRADGSPSVKLLDFGISKLTAGSDDASVDPALTTTATIMGSPSYMSPEQLKSTKEVDQRADVWSLGAVLYEALTAKPAFRGESVPQVCAMIASEDPVPPSSLRQGLPADLEHAILRCLEKKPDQRGDLLELARALANFAPERARVSLERIEGKLGVAESKPRTPTLAQIEQRKKVADLPILPFATPERARTQSSWGQERRGKRGGGGALVLLLLLAGGVLGVGLYSGRFNGVRGQLAGATSAVTSAAGGGVIGCVVGRHVRRCVVVALIAAGHSAAERDPAASPPVR